MPDHGLLHRRGRVAGDLQPVLRGDEQRDAARLAERQRRLHVLAEERLLHRHGVGLQLGDSSRSPRPISARRARARTARAGA